MTDKRVLACVTWAQTASLLIIVLGLTTCEVGSRVIDAYKTKWSCEMRKAL